MPTHRLGSVWGGKGVGWISKREEEDAKYENMGDGWPYFIAICRFWPDFFVDVLRSDDAPYELAFLQRMLLRIYARYKRVAVTGGRGTTKSYTIDLEGYTEMMNWPGISSVIFGPSGKQSAGIARKIYKQIEMNYPSLVQMLTIEHDSSEGVFEVTTMFGSSLGVDAFRGNTVHKAVAEETAQEDKQGVFPEEKFRENVVPQVRAEYTVNKKIPKSYISRKVHSITSAGRRQQYAYQFRASCLRGIALGKSAYVLDVSYEVALLCQIRTPGWAEDQKELVGLSGWPREMESLYSGNEKNPLVPDDMLDSARCLLLTENHHCCKDRDEKMKPEDVIYVVGYDVSYRDNKRNAKCAVSVAKLTKQTDFVRRDKYLKQIVWLEDWTPGDTPTPIMQAQRLKKIWARYCFEGSQTYIAIDAWQVGNDVMLALMTNLDDGLRPLCTYNHMEYTELELEGAIPVIYPVRAGGLGVRDPDSAMIDYAQKQFMYQNIQLLTSNMNAGVEEYKKAHRIKDDSLNYKISQPYKQTNELILQIQNLREEPSGQGIKERRMSNHIQRDYWSCTKYALWFSGILERANLSLRKQTSGWAKMFSNFKKGGAPKMPSTAAQRQTLIKKRGRIC